MYTTYQAPGSQVSLNQMKIEFLEGQVEVSDFFRLSAIIGWPKKTFFRKVNLPTWISIPFWTQIKENVLFCFLSPPVLIAWWAHLHRFLSVCVDLTKNRGK